MMLNNNILVNILNWRLLTIFGLFVALTFTSCEKEELPVPKHETGDAVGNKATIGSSFENQLYFDLETNEFISQNIKTAWDLGFETSPNGFGIILNTSKSMFAANTGVTKFETVTTTDNLIFGWDEPSGNMDSTAIGDWRNSNYIYVVDRGYSEKGEALGYKKIQFKSVTTAHYEVEFANLDGTENVTMLIPKDQAYTFTHLSFNNKGELKIIQPPKEDWDISFTQFTHIFYDETPVLPYLVAGIIQNRSNVEVAEIAGIAFEKITLNDATTASFSNFINKIGYNWKRYSFSSSSYVVDAKRSYIIKSTEGKYFKIHFTDFYDADGNKGTFSFEYQEL